MAKILILGAGVSGHTAARYLGKWLGRQHEVMVVSPNTDYNWIPSNIWVGIGKLEKKDVIFDLEKIYKKTHVRFILGKAVSIHPEGDSLSDQPFVKIQTSGEAVPLTRLDYDYLINATGPKLNFAATPGLGPLEGFTHSVCTADHAVQANEHLQRHIAAMREGAHKTFVVGTGHGTCTCQGAAFEYLFNVDFVLRQEKVRHLADIYWISNEYELGDFGMGSLHIKSGGYMTNSMNLVESLMAQRDIKWIKQAAVNRIEPDIIHYELLNGSQNQLNYDFAMLIPPFAGVGLQAFNKAGEDITTAMFLPNAFMKVDGNYTPKKFEEYKASDWPKTYQSPLYPNVFAIGIAFAPPHPISKPMTSPNGTSITPMAPRTGMPSASMAKAVATSIRDMIKNKNTTPTHTASMADIGAACIASTGFSLNKGTAASIMVYPVVPDFERYPDYGRDTHLTSAEIGLAGHWLKYLLHFTFIYQAEMKPGWWLLPD